MDQLKISIEPRGVIFLSLGGFTAESEGFDTGGYTEKVEKGLAEWMENNSLVLFAIDGELRILEIKEEHLKKKESWFRRLFTK